MKETSTLIDTIRSLMPASTMYLLGRPLTEPEARIVAERQAGKVLELFGITGPSVEVELLAELPGIEVEVLPNLPLSGTSEWIRDHWHVRINADDSLWRCRSTLAHEFKHILDDPFREQLYPDWPRDSGLPPPIQAENISEYFAGCMLVPRSWLYEAWDKGTRDPGQLAALFDVSQSLIVVRMAQTRVISRHTGPSAGSQPYTRRRLRCASATRHPT